MARRGAWQLTADHRELYGRPQALDVTFFERPATEVAHDLLGCLLVREQEAVVRIVEAEAYRRDDPASHAYRGPTPRVASMFGPVGRAYVYFTYGMHWCLNVSCEGDGIGAAVLIRAAAPVRGEGVIRERRGPDVAGRDLLRGPARLTRGLGIGRAEDGLDLTDEDGPLWLGTDGWSPPQAAVRQGPRVGVRLAADLPWRWWIDEIPEVSRYAAHPAHRRST